MRGRVCRQSFISFLVKPVIQPLPYSFQPLSKVHSRGVYQRGSMPILYDSIVVDSEEDSIHVSNTVTCLRDVCLIVLTPSLSIVHTAASLRARRCTLCIDQGMWSVFILSQDIWKVVEEVWYSSQFFHLALSSQCVSVSHSLRRGRAPVEPAVSHTDCTWTSIVAIDACLLDKWYIKPLFTYELCSFLWSHI